MKRALLFSILIVPLCISSLWSAIGMQDAFPGLPFWARPIAVIDPYDGTDRLFLVEHKGIITVFENDPAVNTTTTFLDIESRVIRLGESGLVGLAFHPNYENNGYFYVMYVVPHSPEPFKQILSRFTVSANPDSADTLTEQILMELPKTNNYHVGGRMRFGPDDGYLYVVIGDDGVPTHSQDRTNLYGNLLRIDVDSPAGGKNYGIPVDNPFVGNGSGWHEEIYAWGVRNTWGLSIDPITGRIWGGEVGLDSWEEVNIIGKGNNMGWPILEGPICYIPDPCDTTGLNLTDPIYVYPHPGVGGPPFGFAIIGGHVYRGNRIPSLSGWYIFHDYILAEFFALFYDGVNPPTVEPIGTFDTWNFFFTNDVDKDGNMFFPNSNGRIYQFTGTFTPPVGIGTPGPGAKHGTLAQNYPNPFNPTTTIDYEVTVASRVELGIYDVSGRLVRTLVNRAAEPGNYTVDWDGRDNAGATRVSGVYFYRLKVDGVMTDTLRMVLLK